MIIGAGITYAANVSDKCIAGISGTLEDAYLIYFYINAYILTSATEDRAYAMTYCVAIVKAIMSINCTTIGQNPVLLIA